MTNNGNLAAAILKPDYVLTPEGLKKGWGVRVEKGRITCVGPWDQLDRGKCAGGGPADQAEKVDQAGKADRIGEDAQVLLFPGQMLMPGFVNGHNHMYGVLSHGITAEAMVTNFSNYLEDFWWPYVEDRVDHDLARITTRWACAEMIDSGVTSFVDILEGPNSIPGVLEVEKEEVERAGLRGFLSFEACERKSHENGLAGLKENYDFAMSCSRGSGKDGMVKGVMSIHTLFTCGGDFIREAKGLADEAGCLLHMHLSESDFEPAWAREHLGLSPVEAYERLGCLDGNVLASQLVQVSDEEIAILAKRGVKGVSMPLSNCEVGGGVAPIGRMLEAGIPVGLGTDGYINNFFEVMRGAFLIHKGYLKAPDVMPAKQVYHMATELGARAVGIEAGAVKEGMLADLITVDLSRPTPVNEYNVYDQLVVFSNPRDVVNVMAGGVWLKRDGKLLTLDKEAVRKELAEKTEKFWKGDQNAVN